MGSAVGRGGNAPALPAGYQGTRVSRRSVSVTPKSSTPSSPCPPAPNTSHTQQPTAESPARSKSAHLSRRFGSTPSTPNSILPAAMSPCMGTLLPAKAMSRRHWGPR